MVCFDERKIDDDKELQKLRECLCCDNETPIILTKEEGSFSQWQKNLFQRSIAFLAAVLSSFKFYQLVKFASIWAKTWSTVWLTQRINGKPAASVRLQIERTDEKMAKPDRPQLTIEFQYSLRPIGGCSLPFCSVQCWFARAYSDLWGGCEVVFRGEREQSKESVIFVISICFFASETRLDRDAAIFFSKLANFQIYWGFWSADEWIKTSELTCTNPGGPLSSSGDKKAKLPPTQKCTPSSSIVFLESSFQFSSSFRKFYIFLA